MKAISVPVATSIIISVLSELFSVFESSLCFKLSAELIFAILVYTPGSPSCSVLLNVTVVSILSPGFISLFTKLMLLIVYDNDFVHPSLISEWKSILEGISSKISYTFPVKSPTFVINTLYSTTTVEPTNCLECIDILANFLLL